jgi:3-hydroxymyristoyl/3-hydroxydecanoyl-(acyl carrier protein) dehydratase
MPAVPSSVFSVGNAHPSLPGHFPGTPVVPGVVLLNHVLAELQQRFPDLHVTGINKVKFLLMLLPEQEVAVEFAAPVAATMQFKCWQNGAVLAEGRLALRSTGTERLGPLSQKSSDQ